MSERKLLRVSFNQEVAFSMLTELVLVKSLEEQMPKMKRVC